MIDIKVHYIAEFLFQSAEQLFIRNVYGYYRSVFPLNVVGLSCKIIIFFGYNVRADNTRLFAYFVKPVIKRVSRAQRIAVGRGVC